MSPEGLREEYDYEASGSEPSMMDDEDNLADVAEEESACNQVVEPWTEDGQDHSGALIVRHSTSRLIHALADETGTVLKCGRWCAANFERLDFVFPTCKRCF